MAKKRAKGPGSGTSEKVESSVSKPAVNKNPIIQAWHVSISFLRKDGFLPWLTSLLIAFILIKFVFYPLVGLALGTSLPLVAVMSGSMTHDSTAGTICGMQTAPEYDSSLDAYWSLCGNWYTQRNLSKEIMSESTFPNGFQKGDIMLLVGVNRGSIKPGDVIVFESRDTYPIIHRVIWVSTDENGKILYATKGDHNPTQISQYYVVNDKGAASQCSSKTGEPLPCGFGAPVTKNTPGALALVDETSIPKDAVIGRAVFRIPWLGWVRIGFTNGMNWILHL